MLTDRAHDQRDEARDAEDGEEAEQPAAQRRVGRRLAIGQRDGCHFAITWVIARTARFWLGKGE